VNWEAITKINLKILLPVRLQIDVAYQEDPKGYMVSLVFPRVKFREMASLVYIPGVTKLVVIL